MTSNLGAAYLNALEQGPIPAHVREMVMGTIEAHFPPEFRNRIDEIIIYVRFLFRFIFFFAQVR
jgi:ATP-dependent Clp protease ATP-binding subunit ClpB